MTKKQITITINDKTHQFKAGDVDAMRELPWSERKQLIDLLENIKQAEYVKTDKITEPPVDAGFNAAHKSAPQSLSKPITPKKPTNPQQKSANELDPAVKASDKDVDDLMTRLILEQKSSHQSVPDKSAVIKILLIVFAIIIALALVF